MGVGGRTNGPGELQGERLTRIQVGEDHAACTVPIDLGDLDPCRTVRALPRGAVHDAITVEVDVTA